MRWSFVEVNNWPFHDQQFSVSACFRRRFRVALLSPVRSSTIDCLVPFSVFRQLIMSNAYFLAVESNYDWFNGFCWLRRTGTRITYGKWVSNLNVLFSYWSMHCLTTEIQYNVLTTFPHFTDNPQNLRFFLRACCSAGDIVCAWQCGLLSDYFDLLLLLI